LCSRNVYKLNGYEDEGSSKKLGEEVEIRATSESKFKQYEDDTDILLLGPQVGFLLNKYKQTYEPKGIKVEVIDSIDYGM
jgi:PTS system, Lactose/Cellobiose specific IIB subunit.